MPLHVTYFRQYGRLSPRDMFEAARLLLHFYVAEKSLFLTVSARREYDHIFSFHSFGRAGILYLRNESDVSQSGKNSRLKDGDSD